jgi:hypothetical protein
MHSKDETSTGAVGAWCTQLHIDELTMVSINIVLKIKAECWMNAKNKDGFGKGRANRICAKNDRDTVFAINVRCRDGGDDGDRCRRELIHWKGNEFAVKWRHWFFEGAQQISRKWRQSNDGWEQRLLLISHVHDNLRPRRTASFAVMSLINNMMCAQFFTIGHLVEVADMLGGGAISK